MMTALAPAACAFAALSTKVQAPRSMIAILPAIAAGSSSAVQPLAGDATTTLPAKLAGVAAGPNEAEPNSRSEEHTSELQSLMRISYAVFCLKKKKTRTYKPNQ